MVVKSQSIEYLDLSDPNFAGKFKERQDRFIREKDLAGRSSPKSYI